MPGRCAEAAATLVGFLTAGEFARQRFGTDSETYRNLAREPELFLHKAHIVNRYFDELGRLYAAVRTGHISRGDALAQKQRAYAALERECGAIAPEPRSFNRCLGANNNAGLAFDATYTKYYPLLYEVYRAHGGNFPATLDKLKQVFAAGKLSESEAVRCLEQAAQR